MGERFNIYCDESCHLEHDRASVMVLGASWCAADRVKEISVRLRELKQKHGVLSAADLQASRLHQFEVKWTKVSPAKLAFYLDWIDYFFDDDDLHFRGVLIEKHLLKQPSEGQSHDDTYYKMLFALLLPIVDPEQHYRIYLDIKDTRSEKKRKKLEETLRYANIDDSHTVVDHVQQIRSHESEIMQLTDLLIGAIGYFHRRRRGELPGPTNQLSMAKWEVIDRIRKRSRKTLERSTWPREEKFNFSFLQNPEAIS
jgi:hypothetical protein